MFDKVVVTTAFGYLMVKHGGAQTELARGLFLADMVLLVDPWEAISFAISKTNAVVSGSVLRGVCIQERRDVGDYLPAFLGMAGLYACLLVFPVDYGIKHV